jgi:hypothetical protein
MQYLRDIPTADIKVKSKKGQNNCKIKKNLYVLQCSDYLSTIKVKKGK